MLPKYLKITAASSPEWMNNLQKKKFLKYAEIKENNFHFVFGTITAKVRCKFTIFFYTMFDGAGRSSFVAMDQTNGKLYLIKYWEDHMDTSTYAIEHAEY